jgi:hypothetical protein
MTTVCVSIPGLAEEKITQIKNKILHFCQSQQSVCNNLTAVEVKTPHTCSNTFLYFVSFSNATETLAFVRSHNMKMVDGWTWYVTRMKLDTIPEEFIVKENEIKIKQ